MRWGAFFLLFVIVAAGCVVEDKPVGGGGAGGAADPCGGCEGETPACDPIGEICVECTVAQDAYCEARGQVCDDDSNTCVACEIEDGCCTESSACTAPDASRCALESNECAPCEADTDCDGVEGLPASGNTCDEGVCRACTPETEAETCPSNTSCNPATYECSGQAPGSLAVCEACVADSECGEGGEPSEAHRCVPMEYQGEAFPGDGTGFCLKTTLGGCEQPYSITLSGRSSLSGETGSDYCGINESLATCDAVNALVNNARCDVAGDDAECPQPSGLCRRVGALEERCTYRCGIAAQCPEDPPADTCGSSGSGGEDYCGG